MLTTEALKERKWGAFPALRQVLEDKPSSDRHYGLSSVSDNIFERIQRLVDIAVTAEEHGEELLDAVRREPDLGRRIADDLFRLREELDALRHSFSREIEAIERLCREAAKAAHQH